MLVVGLTGSIGMGKSAAAAVFRSLGVPVHDADAVVHRLLSEDRQVVSAIEAAFPGVVKNNGINRTALGNRVFKDKNALARLEAIIHPHVRAAERAFLRAGLRRRQAVVVLDIPLLFETGSERRCDAVVVVSAPYFLQRRRVLARPGMTEAKFQDILARQLSDAEKRRRADFVIRTGLSRGYARSRVRKILKELTNKMDERQQGDKRKADAK